MEDSDIERGIRLETAIIFSERMEELAGFYEKALEIGPYQRAPGHAGRQLGEVYLGFDQIDDPTQSPTGVTLWFTVDDLQATFDRMVELGAQVRYPPTRKPWGGYLASLYDPDGNLLGLSQRRLESELDDG